ncbi:hypothetical protein L3V82_00735 [Thiotrichales bacterium 19S3-7]|nr:hypothetical protein [Thiotrichales bacterium 19S3-7]MCF6800688.1 hypothetical protein [Thiotrichales bacterium 19S3-11]
MKFDQVAHSSLGDVYTTKKNILFFIAFFLFTLYEFYYPGYGRVFDYAGIIILLIGVFTTKKGVLKLGTIAPDKFSLFLMIVSLMFVLWFSCIAIVAGDILSSLAVLIGVLIVLHYTLQEKVNMKRFANFLDAVIIFNAIVFIIQLLMFKLFGDVLNFTHYAGSISARIYNESLNYFRPAGLYQEPNSYCTSVFMLIILRHNVLVKPRKLISWVAALTLVISQSLWGMGAFVLWVMLYTSNKEKLYMLGVIFILLLYTSFTGKLSYFIEHSVTLHRLSDIDADPSKEQRYGLLANYLSPNHFLGLGINTNAFQTIAANGIAFVIYSFGLVGFLCLGLTLSYLFVRLYAIRALIAIAFLLTTYPLMTYMIFWIWLGLLIRFNLDKYRMKNCSLVQWEN